MTIEDKYSVNEMKIITLYNEKISLSIIPELGGVITSLKYIPTNTELLAQVREPKNISLFREGYMVDDLLDIMFVGGYYEVLPNAGYLSTYNGVKFGLHDETPYLPWKAEYDEERDPNSILLIVQLLKYPLKLYKRISLKNNIIMIEEKLINQSPTAKLPFSWLHHPTFGEGIIDENAFLELPANTVLEVDSYLPSDTACLKPGYKGTWPIAIEKDGKYIDLSRFPPKGTKNCDDLIYIPSVVDGKFKIKNPRKGISIQATWDKNLFGSLWLWRPIGGGDSYPWYGNIYATAVEISTSIPATGLADQVRLKTAKWIGPKEEIKTSLMYEIKEEV
jgi:galactose mutarotase-like enzyme